MPSGVEVDHVEVDHVVLGVPDLDAAARALDERHGLTALPGGRHRGWGTHNLVVPLGDTYLELVAVADPDEAATSAFGRWVTAMASGASSPGWVVRTQDIDAMARRLGLQVGSGSRESASGGLVSWRLAGVSVAAADPCLPFVIQWGAGVHHPGRARVAHAAGRVRLGRLEVEADVARLTTWLGGPMPGVELRAGARGVTAVVLVTAAGDSVLDLQETLGSPLHERVRPTAPRWRPT